MKDAENTHQSCVNLGAGDHPPAKAHQVRHVVVGGPGAGHRWLRSRGGGPGRRHHLLIHLLPRLPPSTAAQPPLSRRPRGDDDDDRREEAGDESAELEISEAEIEGKEKKEFTFFYKKPARKNRY